MSVDAIKMFRPQDGDIVIVDFNKVNVTNVEQALKDSKVPVIAVHDIDTIKMYGIREQKDFTQENADLHVQLESAQAEIKRLNRVIKDDMIPKPTPVAATSATHSTSVLPSPKPNK